ncbi:hypothetical protein LXL04_013428 [Taraxacum kok-saghyz]
MLGNAEDRNGRVGKCTGSKVESEEEAVENVENRRTEPVEKILGGSEVLMGTVLWELWKARNDQAFKNKKVNPMKMAEDIQVKAFNWLKNRASIDSLNWHMWCNNPTVS